MAQNLGYNYDFHDEDADRLCQLAPFANASSNRYYCCGWTAGQSICNAAVPGPEFAEHLRVYHGVTGPDKTKLRCYWTGCGSIMNKESVVRHVQEMHLNWKYACPVCSEEFSRNNTMTNHWKKH
ncbi:hypothetical protein BS17DRAFT_780898 [Gyrodon lividus]|nr:hypothetical protein BS17DRAFT_780898 [Gyrodon lividus]